MVQRIMNTVEKTTTGVTPAQLILNNSISLSSQILQSQRTMFLPDTTRPDHQIALSDRMDEWISKQTTLITVAREYNGVPSEFLRVIYTSSRER